MPRRRERKDKKEKEDFLVTPIAWSPEQQLEWSDELPPPCPVADEDPYQSEDSFPPILQKKEIQFPPPPPLSKPPTWSDWTTRNASANKKLKDIQGKQLKQNNVIKKEKMSCPEEVCPEEVKETCDPKLTNIINQDDKLLFSLNVLGSLQKNEKLIDRGELLSVDERWFFQGVRRWWSVDSKEKSSNKAVMIVTATSDRVKKLLDEVYIAKLSSDTDEAPCPGTPEGKRFVETCEERKRLINKYFIALNKAKAGLENIRDTYDDKFTKEAFKLSIEKVDDILILLQKFERSS